MRARICVISALLAAPLLGGCVARAVADVVTEPVRIGARAVDMATTSRAEADQKRGRALRQREERLGSLSRKRDKLARQCATSEKACEEQSAVKAEIEAEMARPI